MSSHQVVEGWRTKGDREKLRKKKMVGKIGKHAEELHHLQSRLATCEFHLWISYSTDNEHCTNALSLSLTLSFAPILWLWVDWKVSWVESECGLRLAPACTVVCISSSRSWNYAVVFEFFFLCALSLALARTTPMFQCSEFLSCCSISHATFARVICPCVSANSLLPFSDMHTIAFVCKCLPNWICLSLSLNIVDFYALF